MCERINIGNDNTCSLCHRKYQFRRRLTPTETIGLIEIDLITECCRCRALLRRRKEFENKLLDIEWEIFGLQYTNYFKD
jgi:hypothetical protein